MQPLNPTDAQNPRSVQPRKVETVTDERLTVVTPRPTGGGSAVGYLVAALLAAALIAGAIFMWQSTSGTTNDQPAGNQVEADVSAPVDPVIPGP